MCEFKVVKFQFNSGNLGSDSKPDLKDGFIHPYANPHQPVDNGFLGNGRKPIAPSGFQEVWEFFYGQKKSREDAESFFNHYDALGWYSNGQPIMNWRSKALNWSKSKYQSNNEVNPKPDETDTKKKRNDFWNRKWE